MIGKLNHVGVATPPSKKAGNSIATCSGCTDITEKRALPEQGVWVSFVNLPNAQIELIEPYGEASPIHAFLAKNPQGRPAPRLFRGGGHPRRAGRSAGQRRDGAGDRRAAHGRPRRAGDLRPPQGQWRGPGGADADAQGGRIEHNVVIPQSSRELIRDPADVADRLGLGRYGWDDRKEVMDLYMSISVYLVLWWVVFFAVATPRSAEPITRRGSRCRAAASRVSGRSQALKKFRTTTWVSALIFAVIWVVYTYGLVKLPGCAERCAERALLRRTRGG